ncbi:MAG: pitrilysin family protein [Kistimonas sp.]|nr:pitrilysin family protein [Kistimonas sp.]
MIKKNGRSGWFPASVRRVLSLYLGALLLGGCSPTDSPATTALPEAEIAWERFTLPNGLTVIVNEDHRAPLVAVNLWYKTGSGNEAPGTRGFAHLFEHLMFQGSENYQDEFFIPFRAAGATDQNGTTNSDRTNYFQTVPRPALDMALWMESDRMGHFLSAISQERLDEQRRVVKNEKRQSENRPYGRLWGRMAEQTFPQGHPYSWPTIGYMEDLDAADLEQVRQWFARWYTPSNAVLVLSGDIDRQQAQEKAEKYFGDIPAGLMPPERLRTWIAARTQDKRDSFQDRVPLARLVKVWNVPPDGTLAAEELSLAASVLGDGRNSRLYKRLVIDDKLAVSAGAFLYARLLAGQLIVSVDARSGVSLADVETAVDEEVDRFLREGPTEDELNRVRFSQAAAFVRATEQAGGLGGRADILAQGEALHADPGFYKTSLNRMKAATPSSVRSCAAQWLGQGAYILEVTPFPEYSHAQQGADRRQVPEVGQEMTMALPRLERAVLDNGLKVVLARRSLTPVVQMGLHFDAGLAAHGDKPGLPGLTLAMLDEGTSQRDHLSIASELEALGARLETDNSLDSSSVYLDTLTVSLDPALAIFADVLMDPVFPKTSLERVRSQVLAEIAREKANPGALAGRLLPGLLYPDHHGYNTPWSGTGVRASVESITREQLVGFRKAWLRPDNATLVVTGDITLAALVEKLTDVLGEWKVPDSAPPRKPLSYVTPPSRSAVYLVDYPGAQQTVIVGGQLVIDGKDQRRLAFDLANDIVGGQFVSRINLNLREDKGWAYGAGSQLRQARSQRPWLVTAAVQADKTAAALTELLKEQQGFAGDNPPSQQELEQARQHRIRRLPGSLETNGALLGAIETLVKQQLPDSDLYDYVHRVRSLSLDEVQQIARDYMAPDKMIWLLAGDLQRIKKQLKAAGLPEPQVLDQSGKPVVGRPSES